MQHRIAAVLAEVAAHDYSDRCLLPDAPPDDAPPPQAPSAGAGGGPPVRAHSFLDLRWAFKDRGNFYKCTECLQVATEGTLDGRKRSSCCPVAVQPGLPQLAGEAGPADRPHRLGGHRIDGSHA